MYSKNIEGNKSNFFEHSQKYFELADGLGSDFVDYLEFGDTKLKIDS